MGGGKKSIPSNCMRPAVGVQQAVSILMVVDFRRRLARESQERPAVTRNRRDPRQWFAEFTSELLGQDRSTDMRAPAGAVRENSARLPSVTRNGLLVYAGERRETSRRLVLSLCR